MKLLITTTLLLLFSGIAFGQNCESIEDCNEKLATASRIINRSTEEIKIRDNAIEALKLEISARERLSTIDNELLQKKDAIIADQQKLILILEKSSKRKLSIFFGLVKIHL